jgi:hypothetical protein
MTIRVTQPDTGYASHSVRIMIDGVYVGDIGRGGSVSGQSSAPAEFPWKVEAICGSYRAESVGHGDADLQIHWLIPPAMEMRKIAK